MGARAAAMPTISSAEDVGVKARAHVTFFRARLSRAGCHGHVPGALLVKKNIKNRCKGRPGQAQTHIFIYTSACASGDASPGGGEGEREEGKEGSMRSSRSQGAWGDGEAGGPSCSGGGDRDGVRGGDAVGVGETGAAYASGTARARATGAAAGAGESAAGPPLCPATISARAAVPGAARASARAPASAASRARRTSHAECRSKASSMETLSRSRTAARRRTSKAMAERAKGAKEGVAQELSSMRDEGTERPTRDEGHKRELPPKKKL